MLASEVMDQAASILNDTALSLYTYAVQTPYLKQATEVLQKRLAVFGIQVERVVSASISVAANATYVTLPADFLLPVSLQERNVGENDDQWVDMDERAWEPITEPIAYIEYWSFRNNRVYIRECSVAKEVRMKYIRTLTAISSSNSTVDVDASKNYLAAKTAELCARYIGQNSDLANEIAGREVEACEDDLLRMYVLQGQSANRGRRRPFRAKSVGVY